jgi:hypothetical protein
MHEILIEFNETKVQKCTNVNEIIDVLAVVVTPHRAHISTVSLSLRTLKLSSK